MKISSMEQCHPEDNIKQLWKIYKVEEEFWREMSPPLHDDTSVEDIVDDLILKSKSFLNPWAKEVSPLVSLKISYEES